MELLQRFSGGKRRGPDFAVAEKLFLKGLEKVLWVEYRGRPRLKTFMGPYRQGRLSRRSVSNQSL
jgi:hypothetical protein